MLEKSPPSYFPTIVGRPRQKPISGPPPPPPPIYEKHSLLKKAVLSRESRLYKLLPEILNHILTTSIQVHREILKAHEQRLSSWRALQPKDSYVVLNLLQITSIGRR